jgi:ATP-dependent DNA helicase RecG
MTTDEQEIINRIGQGESLSLEFKSDQKSLPDRDLVTALVSLANTEGGELLLGVEDDGSITGLHPLHHNVAAIPSLVANRTNPALSVKVTRHEVQGTFIARIIVTKSRQLVSTSEGLLVRRRLKLDGTPEAIPFYPHEFIQRQSSLGLVDPSAMVIEEVESAQLDPLQRLRIRNAIKKHGGEQSLLALADEELEGALGLSLNTQGTRRPTVTGLLLLGTEELLRMHLPAYEVAFQVLHGTDVRVNEFFRKPLLETFEQVELLFNARVEEEEIQVGLFRVPVPNFDRRAFREALVNALVHRDFSRLGAVHIKITDDGLSISNPGGFVEGVRLDNLLVADPRSRNPLLADVIKRIGLAERTGRGIDRIYEGMLRYGRPAPDYTKSDEFTVSVQMLTTADLISSVQKPEAVVRGTLEKLVETGFLEPHGSGRGRTYTLSAALYRQAGKKSEYIRQAGFAPIQQEQMVLKYIATHGGIKRADTAELCRISPFQATRLLKRMEKNGLVRPVGQGKGTQYVQST